ncbi:MAG: ferrous iron transport protein A [Defluviitaleaceae bacterium]|nr:ferrous iron transport protein A [Defluviitaleaceae bacterium]
MTTGVKSLYTAKKQGVFEVASLPGISLLENLGLRVGTRVTVKGRYAFGGPVLLRVENAFLVAIGKDIATQIAVKEVACYESPQCPTRR